MALTSCECFPFELPLVAPLASGKQTLLSRAGFVIRLTDASGNQGYGEVAPFPGWHREDWRTALGQCEAVKGELLGRILPDSLARLDGGFDDWLAVYDLCPSLRYGLEMAVLNLLACRWKTSLAALLNPRYPRIVSVSALWVGGQRWADEAGLLALRAAGFAAVKLKVGRTSLEEEIDLVRMARRVLGRDMAIRLDANRAWDFPTALDFARAIEDVEIEYIEEPLSDPAQLSAFHAQTGIPLALDESLIGQAPAAMVVAAGVEAFVLKPAVLGGLERMNGFFRVARRCGIKAVASSMFETGIGLAVLANCAAALAGGEHPAGLDTYRWLGDDLLQERFDARAATLEVDRMHCLSRRLKPTVFCTRPISGQAG